MAPNVTGGLHLEKVQFGSKTYKCGEAVVGNMGREYKLKVRLLSSAKIMVFEIVEKVSKGFMSSDRGLQFDTTNLAVYNLSDVTQCKHKGNSVVEILVSEPATSYYTAKTHGMYNSKKIGKADSDCTKISDLTNFAKKLVLNFIHKPKKGSAEAEMFVSQLNNEVSMARWKKQNELEKIRWKEEEKREIEEYKLAVKRQKEDEEKKEASLPKPAAKNQKAMLFTFEDFEKMRKQSKSTSKSSTSSSKITGETNSKGSTPNSSRIPSHALKSITKWKLSGGNEVLGSEADWKRYYEARVDCENKKDTHCAIETMYAGDDENGKEMARDFLNDCRYGVAKALVSTSSGFSENEKAKLGSYAKIEADEALNQIAAGLFIDRIDIEFAESETPREVNVYMRFFSSIASPNVVDLNLFLYDRDRMFSHDKMGHVLGIRSFGKEIPKSNTFNSDLSVRARLGTKEIKLYETEAHPTDYFRKEKEKLCAGKDAVGLLDAIIGPGRVKSNRKAFSALLRASGCAAGDAAAMSFDPIGFMAGKNSKLTRFF